MAKQATVESITSVSTRRAFLCNAAALSAAATAVPGGIAAAVPSVTRQKEVAQPAVNDTDAELCKLGAQIVAVIEAVDSAAVREQQSFAMARALLPELPAELIARREDPLYDVYDCAGARWVKGDSLCSLGLEPRNAPAVFTAKRMREKWDVYGLNRRSKIGRRVAALIPLAEKHEAETQAAVDRSALQQATFDYTLAIQQTHDIAHEMCRLGAKTPDGVVAMSLTLNVLEEMAEKHRMACRNYHNERYWLGRSITQSILVMNAAAAGPDDRQRA